MRSDETACFARKTGSDISCNQSDFFRKYSLDIDKVRSRKYSLIGINVTNGSEFFAIESPFQGGIYKSRFRRTSEYRLCYRNCLNIIMEKNR